MAFSSGKWIGHEGIIISGTQGARSHHGQRGKEMCIFSNRPNEQRTTTHQLTRKKIASLSHRSVTRFVRKKRGQKQVQLSRLERNRFSQSTAASVVRGGRGGRIRGGVWIAISKLSKDTRKRPAPSSRHPSTSSTRSRHSLKKNGFYKVRYYFAVAPGDYFGWAGIDGGGNWDG